MKNAIIAGTIAAAMAGAAWQPALAADLAPAPVYTKAAPIDTWSPWELRVRALGVLPDASGSTVNVIGAPGLSSPNSGLKIGDSVVPELDITYFFSKNLAAELILGVTPHHITGTGALAGLDIGKTWLLPPTLTVQYHFTNFGAFQPYVGVGVNYTAFFSTSAANAGGPLSVTSLGVTSTFGAAAQVGFDYMIDRHWGLNFDVKKLYMEPKFDATVNNIIAVNGRANINPWLIGGGVAYKF
jgi:outer membrane protein